MALLINNDVTARVLKMTDAVDAMEMVLKQDISNWPERKRTMVQEHQGDVIIEMIHGARLRFLWMEERQVRLRKINSDRTTNLKARLFIERAGLFIFVENRSMTYFLPRGIFSPFLRPSPMFFAKAERCSA